MARSCGVRAPSCESTYRASPTSSPPEIGTCSERNGKSLRSSGACYYTGGRLTTRNPLSSIGFRSAGGTCDQARHRQRHRAENEHHPNESRTGGGNRLRGDEKRAGPRRTHRTSPLRRIQRETAKDGHRPQSAHRTASEHPSRKSGALQARQGTSGTPAHTSKILIRGRRHPRTTPQSLLCDLARRGILSIWATA